MRQRRTRRTKRQTPKLVLPQIMRNPPWHNKPNSCFISVTQISQDVARILQNPRLISSKSAEEGNVALKKIITQEKTLLEQITLNVMGRSEEGYTVKMSASEFLQDFKSKRQKEEILNKIIAALYNYFFLKKRGI